MLNFILLMGAPPGGQGQGNPFALWLPIILIFAIMYFLIFRPQAKKQKQQRMMIEALRKGDKIVMHLSSGKDITLSPLKTLKKEKKISKKKQEKKEIE